MIKYTDKDKLGRGVLSYIKKNGYTKTSFSKLVDISRPTLNSIIEGSISSETTFRTHITKILKALNIDIHVLLQCEGKEDERSKKLLVAYSNNSPKNHELSDNAKEMFSLVENLINLFEIYL